MRKPSMFRKRATSFTEPDSNIVTFSLRLRGTVRGNLKMLQSEISDLGESRSRHNGTVVRGGFIHHHQNHQLRIFYGSVSYTHLRAHETDSYLVCRLLLEKKKNKKN